MHQSFPVITLETAPTPLYSVWKDFADTPLTPESNFLKGVQWSPDGVCLLTAADDQCVRVFDLPEAAHDLAHATSTPPPPLPLGLAIPQGEAVYDYAWFPGMTSTDPASCCFLTATRAHPLRLWDACSGTLRCSYRSYDCKDEVAAPLSVACSAQGVCLAGLQRRIDVFDLACPGRDCSTITTGQRRRGEDGQIGLISSLALNAHMEGVFAAGCYDGSVGMYDYRTLEQQLLLQGHAGGITQVLWSRDGNYLYSAARRDAQVFCWDVRHVTGAVYCMQRDAAATNQRLAVDIEPVGRHLVSGGTQGQVDLFDLRDGSHVGSAVVAPDTVNGVHIHPYLPLLATASGCRRYADVVVDDGVSSDDEAGNVVHVEAVHDYKTLGMAPHTNSLGVWHIATRVEVPDDSQLGDIAQHC